MGSDTRYATLAITYSVMTMPVPRPSASGTLRRGFLISPAMIVTLFHESAEKSDPTCAAHRATNRPNAVAAVNVDPGATGCDGCRLQKSPKLCSTAEAFQQSVS